MSRVYSAIAWVVLPVLTHGLTRLAEVHGADTPNQKNILMIAVDDLKTIGSLYSEESGNFLQRIYPDANLRRSIAERMTPNFSRLASRGVTFTNAHCASPACNPSRAALMTGVPPYLSGLTTNARGVFFRDYRYQGKQSLGNVTTLPQWLKQHGWYTATTGKIFHNGGSFRHADGNTSWSDWTDVPGNAGKKIRDVYSPRSLDWGVEGSVEATYRELNDFRKADFIGTLLQTGRSRDREKTFVLPEDSPFFLACGIFRPHLPFYASPDLLKLFPTEEMTVTQSLLDEFTADSNDLPDAALKWCGLSRDQSGHPVIGKDRFVDILTHGESLGQIQGKLLGWKRMLQHYFASCAIADRCVGRLLDAVDQSSYRDNTIIILWSDHGYHLGEKLHETKFTLWNDSTNVNLLIADPSSVKGHGSKCNSAVSLLDLFPTLCKQAGLALPNQSIAGHDLSPLLANPTMTWEHPVVCTYESVDSQMILSGRFKLIRYEGSEGQLELYDLENDPEEFTNLAHHPDQAIRVRNLLDLLDRDYRPTSKITE